MELKQTILDSPYSLKDFSKHIAMFCDKEWDEAYYQRIRDILGEERSTITDLEQEAFGWWEHVYEQPFKASLSGWIMRDKGRTLDELWKALRTGNYRRKHAKRQIKELKEAIPNNM